MGKRYLIDSNTIIDFCNGKISPGGKKLLLTIEPEISIITNIELFATKDILMQEYLMLEKFVAMSVVHPVSTNLIQDTIKIRQNYKLKLPDAIIAATALCYSMTLISRNVADFKKVEGLIIIDPYSI